MPFHASGISSGLEREMHTSQVSRTPLFVPQTTTHLMGSIRAPEYTHDSALLEQDQVGRDLFNRACCESYNNDATVPVDELACRGMACLGEGAETYLHTVQHHPPSC
jgi:hypothetical protein